VAGSKLCYKKISLWVVCIALFPAYVSAKEHPFYRMEVGVMGGASYYVGELAPHVFMSTAETYGAQLRVKFDPRWAVQTKVQRQRIAIGESFPLWHVDVVGEYNFFQLGLDEYNIHMRNLTACMFVGFGVSLLKENKVATYLPVGIGLKWKFADRWQLQLAWQHNVYVDKYGDGLEGDSNFDNTHQLNGTNIMNNDIASTLTAGVVFEFGLEERKCVLCERNH
jgi:hypothetical protein